MTHSSTAPLLVDYKQLYILRLIHHISSSLTTISSDNYLSLTVVFRVLESNYAALDGTSQRDHLVNYNPIC